MLLLFSYILIGGFALVVQTVCLRELLVVCAGNELVIGLIFAGWLLGIAIGAGGAARISDRLQSKSLIFLALFSGLALLFPAQIYAIRLLRVILAIPPIGVFPLAQLLPGILLTVTPASLIVGAIFPVACSLISSSASSFSFTPTSLPMGERNSVTSISRIYIAEAIGSLSGGIIFTFVLVTRYNAFQIAAMCGALIFALTGTLACCVVRKPTCSGVRSTGRLVLGGCTYVCCGLYSAALLTGMASQLHATTIQMRWTSFQPDLPLVAALDSQYAQYSLAAQPGQYALFTNGQYVTAFPDEYGQAVTAHVYLAEHPAPQTILLIGGGAEGLLAEILKHPITQLDSVELDPRLFDLLAPYLPSQAQQALRDPRVSVIYADGRYYVKHPQRHYDVVILNLPDPTTAMLNRFYTLEFFHEVQRLLNPGGVLITTLNASLHLQRDAVYYTGSIYATLRAVFPHVLVNPGTPNTYLAASAPGVITLDPEILAQRYRARNIVSDYFSADHYAALLEPEQIRFIEARLQAHRQEFRLNTDVRPITYLYSLLLWTQFSEDQSARQKISLTGRLLHGVIRLPAIWFFAPFMFIICGGLGRWLFFRTSQEAVDPLSTPPLRNRHPSWKYFWAIGTTGLAGMAMELLLIFAFQNLYGYMYQKAGLLVAVFMGGLAAGGWNSQRLAQRQLDLKRIRRSVIVLESLFTLFIFLLPWVLRLLAARADLPLIEPALLLLVGVTGLLTGSAFPLISALVLPSNILPGKTAGMLSSADQVGALCGALVIGTLFIPLLGMTLSCVWVGLLKLSSVSVLFLTDDSPRSLRREG